MNQLSSLEPERVFYYFEEISKIPHGSGNTKKISDYLVSFAKERRLKYRQDKIGNVIIWKDGIGKPVIIQGHMDMVCEMEADCLKDMTKDGLEIYIDENVIRAKGTTLGGDDGIAVAIALALLDSDDNKLPSLEVILTVDEEIGMLGAGFLDVTGVMGKTMLNIDSEAEGVFTVSCAGGCSAHCSIPVVRDAITDDSCGGYYELSISGLIGGHSGIEIHKNRANAIQILGRILQRIRDDIGIRLVDLEGGAKDNAIATSARAIFAIDKYSRNNCSGICELCRTQGEGEEAKLMLQSFKSGFLDGNESEELRKVGLDMSKTEVELLEKLLDTIRDDIRKEFYITDPDISITCVPVKKEKLSFSRERNAISLDTMSVECTNRIIDMLTIIPNGIQRMSPDVEGLVQTSLNKGILTNKREVLPGDMIAEDTVLLTLCMRSSLASEKDILMRQARDIMSLLGGSIEFEGVYPGWKYEVDSPLRDLMIKVFTDQYGYEPKIEAIHAGVECGYFADKIPGLDCVSFGPNLREIHTFRESMEIESVNRTYKLILETLHRLAVAPKL